MNWREFGKICAAVGVTMAALGASVIDILPHPTDNVYVGIQGAIVALGVYAIAQAEGAATESESVSA